MSVMLVPMVVVETPGFLRDAVGRLMDPERDELVACLAANPEAGDIMQGTGGARKLRWKASGRGKRGGVRMIYYYHNRIDPPVPAQCFREEREDRSDQSRAE